MLPSPNPDGGEPLEARLRNLILNNANADATAIRPADIGQQAHGNPQPPHMIPANLSGQDMYLEPPRLPPHMQAATPAEKNDYLANANSHSSGQSTANSMSQGPRKRPNQAQRRQMNSQLSIPIDARPAQPEYSARGYGAGAYQGQARGAGQNQRYPRNQQQSPHFHRNGPPTPYSPQNFFPQHSPQSPMQQYHSGPHQQMNQSHSPYQPQFQQGPYSPRGPPQGRQLYQPGPYQGQGRGTPFNHSPQELAVQATHLETLMQESIPVVVIDPQELAEKETFRALVERACRESIVEHEQKELGNEKFDPLSVELQCFGSMMSGFATKASDMDLALLTPKSSPPSDSPDSVIPRLLEKKLLGLGFGARLLTRTRVPIIKLCQKPTEKLLADLLEERTKWETGFVAEQEDDEVHDVNASGKEQNAETADNSVNPVPAKIFPKLDAKLDGKPHDTRTTTLKQKEHQTLVDYHNNAKRLLRKLGGRDITATSPELNEDEVKILNEVCRAFISGLASPQLSSRLQGCSTIAPLFDQSLQTIQRTLYGISTQVEGERLAMAWENRPLAENDERRELQGLAEVEAWRELQNKQGAIVESLAYDRLLGAAADRLRRLNSLQLVFLEQIPHEEPISYYTRAQKLSDDLRRRDSSGLSDTITPIVMAHYIAGISSKTIREKLHDSVHEDATLQSIGVQHRVLQLVADYQHALSLNVYEETERPTVEQYVVFLGALNYTDPMVRLKTPMTSSEDALTAKVRMLPDPTTVSLNKPRDRYKDHLEFPKTDIGIQCDINFSAHLAIHNTLLLRCYSHCDPRVKAMILFVKHWAKTRGINTPYRGSLSSYGYVLMVLHYLVNVTSPCVCPNLQIDRKDPPSYLPPAEIEARTTCNGCDVRFWRNEAEIKELAERKMLNHNHDSVGILLRGFFEYYAQSGQMSTVGHKGFDWGREVLSLRTKGGILTKQEKGWVGAKTTFETSAVAPPTTAKALESSETVTATAESSEAKHAKPKAVEETKEIRHRYLFALEDPFELDHNVARTVTHNGIVSIRDEFRRAWRIIRNIGKPEQRDGGLLDVPDMNGSAKGSWEELLDVIHGPALGKEKAVGSTV